MSKEKLKNTLFKLARSNISGFFIGFAFENLSGLIPVDKIVENDRVIAFYHPVKHWEQHILIVPKRAVKNFLSIDLEQTRDRNLLVAIFVMAIEVAKKQGLEKFTILVNGGEYQDVPQVHFHLASGKDKYGNDSGQEKNTSKGNDSIIFESEHTIVNEATDFRGKKHLVFNPKMKVASVQDLDFNDEKIQIVLLDMARTAQQMVREINPSGYTLLTNGARKETLCFHLLYEK